MPSLVDLSLIPTAGLRHLATRARAPRSGGRVMRTKSLLATTGFVLVVVAVAVVVSEPFVEVCAIKRFKKRAAECDVDFHYSRQKTPFAVSLSAYASLAGVSIESERVVGVTLYEVRGRSVLRLCRDLRSLPNLQTVRFQFPLYTDNPSIAEIRESLPGISVVAKERTTAAPERTRFRCGTSSSPLSD